MLFLPGIFVTAAVLFLGYKNWLGEDEYVDGIRYKRYASNLGQTFDLKHGNEATLRFIYFLDYNQLRKKLRILQAVIYFPFKSRISFSTIAKTFSPVRGSTL